MSNKAELDKYIYYAACGCAFSSCISVLGMNTFLTMLIFLLLYRTYIDRATWKELLLIDKQILYPIMAIIGSALLSALFDSDIKAGLHEFIRMYIHQMIPMYAVLIAVRDKRELFNICGCLLFSYLINCSYELFQVWQFSQTHNATEIWKYRFSGFHNKMLWSGVLAVGAPFVFTMLLLCETGKKQILYFCGAVIAFLALIFNGARGAWLSAAVMVCLAIVLIGKNRCRNIMIFIVAVVGIGLVFCSNSGLQSRMKSITNTTTNYSNIARIYMWESAWDIFKKHPVVGVGLDNYGKHFEENYNSPELKKITVQSCHAHNNVLHLLAERGLPGALAFLWMWGSCSLWAFNKWRKNNASGALYMFLLLQGMMVQGVTEYNIGTHIYAKIFWFVFAICYNSAKMSPTSTGGGYLVE